MAVQCKELIEVMEALAPECLAESWDNVGLSVGDLQQEIRKILVALDVTEEVIEEAKSIGANLIVTHHPMLLFQKIKNIRKQTPLGRKLYTLIQNEIGVYSAHTNLDIAFGGTNDVLAELAGLEQIELLQHTSAEELKKLVVYVPADQMEQVRQAICEAGGGHIGNYSCCTFGAEGTGSFLPLEGTNPFVGTQGNLEKVKEVRLETIVPEEKLDKVIAAMLQVHPYEEVAYDIYAVEQKGKQYGIGRIGNLKEAVSFQQFAENLRAKLQLDHMRLVGPANQLVKRVGLCTGSGVEFMEKARQLGADVYLTGDIKFHEAQKALEMGLCVIDVTHYASENLIVPVLQKYLREKAKERDWDLEVVCSRVNGQTFWHI